MSQAPEQPEQRQQKDGNANRLVRVHVRRFGCARKIYGYAGQRDIRDHEDRDDPVQRDCRPALFCHAVTPPTGK